MNAFELIPWLGALLFVLFPRGVWRFYRWLIGPDFERRNPANRTDAIRNAGILMLIIIALITYFSRK